MAALTDQHVSLQIRILFHIKLGHLVSVSHMSQDFHHPPNLSWDFLTKDWNLCIYERNHPSPLLLEPMLSCISLSVNHYSHNCPITGSNKIHLMGAPNSKLDFISLFMWAEARKRLYWPHLEKLDKHAYIKFCTSHPDSSSPKTWQYRSWISLVTGFSKD
jgi:hypothetical protein